MARFGTGTPPLDPKHLITVTRQLLHVYNVPKHWTGHYNRIAVSGTIYRERADADPVPWGKAAFVTCVVAAGTASNIWGFSDMGTSVSVNRTTMADSASLTNAHADRGLLLASRIRQQSLENAAIRTDSSAHYRGSIANAAVGKRQRRAGHLAGKRMRTGCD